MAHHKALKRLALLSFLASLYLGVSAQVSAKNAALGEKAANSLEAIEKASKYSFDNAAIGILIAYGSENSEGVTAEVIGDQFIRELNKRGYKARYFFYDAELRGMVMEYHIGYAALGPWDVDEAAQKIGEATQMMDAAIRVHGNEYKD